MTPRGISEEYWRAAGEAGLVVDLDGHPCVAGEYQEPLSGEQQCLVEYADPALLTDRAAARRLARLLAEHFPDSRLAVVRTPAELRMPEPWERHLSYVQHIGAATSPADGIAITPADGIAITPADRRDDEQVARWLVQAFHNAGQHGSVDDAAARRHAQQIIAAPDRRSLIARSSGTAIGHATLLCEAGDDVDGGRFVELLDILIDPPQLRRATTAALVDASRAVADDLGLPLVGNVVHPRNVVHARPAGPDTGRSRVLDSLLTTGWRLRHTYWRMPLPQDGTGGAR
ncbi:hypothetical protein J5Y04_16490 [Kitasatospora sp. RG8]|uniref:hypothetical protein n=1 Tax=Kitasatospora sp. RG8 TaxID=2820815 RepID=UPI001AE099A0|nr:hypothetical protein [Kitasatospora sp. RG8]MBP0451128.1 hypothetical protein [Kitasatospora sp. RG8]